MKYQCEICTRKFDKILGLSIHIKNTHKISKAKYAETFMTNEWVTCYICGIKFYRAINLQKRFDENGKCICACCDKCGQKLANIFSTITKTKSGSHKFIQIKAQKTKIKRNSNYIGARKAADKMIANGFYGSKKHKTRNWVIAGQKAARCPEVRERANKTIYKKFGKFTTWKPMFSIESQNLFNSIEKKINGFEIYYATKNHEYQIVISKKHIFLDFYIPQLNKIIEFDEEYHNNGKQKIKDALREKRIRKYFNNIDILRIKKSDFVANEKNVLDRCLDFLNHRDAHNLGCRR